eukprot:TRINITY_DN21353_c0_g2_i1.p2 TRINITY_DN21353_c0_g2~~TRINITY_DN21353_c0_g2_i1.p2  ORF type:complete len:427 (+),score=90.93 TRINITY_DN21353_c0_g2_i1:1472-2752(+)
MRALRQIRWCSEKVPMASGVAGEKELSQRERAEYLSKKWKPDEQWMYPGAPRAEMEAAETGDSGELIERHFGIFDGPQKGSFTDLGAEAPFTYIKEPMPDWLKSPMKEPMRNDGLYEDTELPSDLATEQKSWVIQRVVDKESWETALGDQLFRTTDLDMNSTELYPVGYGLAVNTCALVIEDDDEPDRFYHICGGRADHKTFMQGKCLTLRVDAELFFHVLNYFGENFGLQQSQQMYHHKYRGMCIWGGGMDEEDLEFMNGFFGICGLSMRVDEERLDEACEGYLPVLYHKRLTPDDPVWAPESSGVFIWQNFLMSVPKELNTDPAHVKRWWYDPYTLRKRTNISARAFNGAADKTAENAGFYDSQWGADGLRGEKIKRSLGVVDKLGKSQSIDIMRPASEPAGVITDPFSHGFRHPIFTTKPRTA